MSDDDEEGSTSDDSEFENEPKSGTDYVVQEAMREEKRKLKSKLRREKNKTVLPSGGEEEKEDDKRSLEEEHAENETIKSKRAIEDATRARKRARNGGDELEKDEDEEKYRVSDKDEEDEQKMDRFDMSKEEQEGYFDPETGNYVEYKKEKKLAEDSWIDETTKEEYEKFKTIKPSSQRLMEAEKAAEEDEEIKYDQTEEGVAKLKRQLAELLEGPTETALKAIKRVGGGSEGPGSNNKNKYVSKQKSKKESKNGTKEQQRQKNSKLEGENKKIFDEITAIASRLVTAGEYDSKTTYEDAEDDMFADSDNDERTGGKDAKKEPTPAVPSTADVKVSVDPKTFSIKELKRCCESHGKSIGSGGERIEIEKMCSELLKSTTSPEGFVYDKSTGLYYGEASNMHWHCKANLYKTEDGNWWKYNGQMFEAASEPSFPIDSR